MARVIVRGGEVVPAAVAPPPVAHRRSEWDDFAAPADDREILELTSPEPKRESKGKKCEQDFADQCRSFRLPTVAREYRFAKSVGRQWRFDFAFPKFMLAIELEGLVVRRVGGELVCGGRHASITGMREDMRKYNTAALMGWTVLRFELAMVKSAEARETVMRFLVARGWKSYE